ncbi:MAG: RnfABCDGE type electron transport complex subunit D [Firmicutes bacterium]|nr:RnfABCDGE type electron transport complex subunit D [Bacillota bacterium]
MENKMRKVTYSPFAHSGNSVNKAMLDVIIALVPVIFASILFFRMSSVLVLLTTTASAVTFEYISRLVLKRYNSCQDLSAVVTGLILGLTLPPNTPLLLAILGSLISIVVVKQLFGGIGNNVFNPAASGRAFLLIAFSVPLTKWVNPITSTYVDATTSATPLSLVKTVMLNIKGGDLDAAKTAYNLISSDAWNLIKLLFTGEVAGSLGETSALAIIIGLIYLIVKKRIHTEIVASYIGSAFVVAAILSFAYDLGPLFPLISILAGGLLFGAVFMATDWVTSPMTKKGRIIFGIGLGILTIIIRTFSNFPEGVVFSILIMNMSTPLIDRYTSNKIFGKVKVQSNEKK